MCPFLCFICDLATKRTFLCPYKIASDNSLSDSLFLKTKLAFLQLRFSLFLDYQGHIGRKISLVAIYRREQRRCADGANAGSRECKKEYRGSGGGRGDVKERQEMHGKVR